MASGIGADHRLPSRAADEAGYPGAPPGAVPGFTPDDATAFWFLDFHWPRGLTPLGMVWLEDGYTHGTHRAAARLPLPAGHGVAARVVGTHVYAASVALAHPAEIEARRRRLQRRLPAFVDAFPGLWERRLDELETGWRALLAEAPAALTRPGLARYLRRARRYHLRAYEIHFEVMYPLAAVATRFYDLCAGLDLDPALSSRVLQGYDNRALQTDRALWALAGSARRLGLAALFAAHDIADLPRALAADPAAAGWLRELDAMLEEFGWRTEGSCDVALPSWVEDPSIPLATVKRLLRQEFPHDMAAAAEAAAADRVVAVDAARARLTRAEQARFDAGLAACTRANFSWWQDEHNAYIDQRAALPLRRAALELARRAGTDEPDDTMFLFWPELLDLADGGSFDPALRGVVRARREFFEHWAGQRTALPRVRGAVPDRVDDPVLVEVFGLTPTYLAAVQAGGSPSARTLSGIAASGGRFRGTARVVATATDLPRLQQGDVLVCESTTPSWTPAFGTIGACVCDGGGTLSHAGIVAREYGVPAVTALGIATQVIRDGDEVDVDGTRGTVTVYPMARH